MKVVLSIGGSVLVPRLEPDRIREYANVILALADDHDLGIVVGGGSTARDYIRTARDLGADEIELDRIGIGVTRLNARLLVAALGEASTLSPPEDYETGAAALRRGEIPVMGGVAPAQTTDAVSASLAEDVGADRLVYATSVPGVFTGDPAHDEDAEVFEELSAGELVGAIADIEMEAGSSAPVDLLAAKVIQRSEIETIVLDGSDPARIERAVRTGEYEGTRIVPDSAQKHQRNLDAFDAE